MVLCSQGLASRCSESSSLLVCKQLGLPIAPGASFRLGGGFFAVRVRGRCEVLDQLPYLQGIVEYLLKLHPLEEHGLIDLGILEINLQSFRRIESSWRLRCSRQVSRGVVNEVALVFCTVILPLGRQHRWFLLSNATLALCLGACLGIFVSARLWLAQR